MCHTGAGKTDRPRRHGPISQQFTPPPVRIATNFSLPLPVSAIPCAERAPSTKSLLFADQTLALSTAKALWRAVCSKGYSQREGAKGVPPFGPGGQILRPGSGKVTLPSTIVVLLDLPSQVICPPTNTLSGPSADRLSQRRPASLWIGERGLSQGRRIGRGSGNDHRQVGGRKGRAGR